MRVYVQIPALSGKYEFDLSDTVSAGRIIAEMTEIFWRNASRESDDAKNFMLLNSSKKTILNAGLSLEENGVGIGDTLILF